MQVSVEKVSTLERRLSISVPAERIEKELDKHLQRTAQRAKISGFRPGKVPMQVIRQRYGASARQQALSEVIQTTFYEAVAQQQLHPAGAPSIEPKVIEQDKDFEYIALFEVFPEVQLASFESIAVERLQAEVQDLDIANMLEILRKQNTRFDAVERTAQLHDQLTIDFSGTINGEAFAGGSAKDTLLVLGSGRMIPGFEDGLVGATSGEQRTITTTFPADYQNIDVAGKAVQFTVDIKSVAAPKVPDLNKEFFALFASKSTSLEEFRLEVRANMERELRQALKTKLKNQVMDGLLASNPLEVPKVLITNEIVRLRTQAAQQFGGNIKPEQLPAELFEEQAKRRVALGLLVSEVIKQYQLKTDEDRVRTTLEELASTYQEPAQVVAWYYQNQAQMDEIRSIVLEDQVIDTVLGRAKITDTVASYEEAVKPAGK